ncbi:MAG: hypothetical protein JWR37_3430, partial [Mycobacterium sp.]|nr:hypothetical protein [Mycobacterium sp.]
LERPRRVIAANIPHIRVPSDIPRSHAPTSERRHEDISASTMTPPNWQRGLLKLTPGFYSPFQPSTGRAIVVPIVPSTRRSPKVSEAIVKASTSPAAVTTEPRITGTLRATH